MAKRIWKHSDVRDIAECAVTLADKAHYWRARCREAEEALRKLSGEVYSRHAK